MLVISARPPFGGGLEKIIIIYLYTSKRPPHMQTQMQINGPRLH